MSAEGMSAERLERWLREGANGEEEGSRAEPAVLAGEYSYDIASGALYWSPELRAMHGLGDDEPLELNRIAALIHPEDRERFRAHVARCVQSVDGGPHEQEFRLDSPTGEPRWMRDTCRIVHERGGEEGARSHAVAVGLVVDVTAEKRASEQLRLANERFRGALNAAQVNVFTQDLDLRYTWVHNPAPELRAADIVGKFDAEVHAPRDARHLTEIKRRVITTGVTQRCEVRLAIGGAVRWYDLTVQAERDLDGHVSGVLGSAVEITPQKQAEEVLRQRSERLALLLEAARGLLATDDPLVFVEELFSKLAVLLDLHVYAHYAVAADGTHLRLAASSGLSAAQRQAMARLEFEQPPCGIVAKTRCPIVVPWREPHEEATAAVHSLGLASYVCHPLIARGELFGTLAFGSATPMEHSEESVALFRAVSDLVALAIARHRAEQSLREADRRKDEFLATLAHELRNPLAPIRSGLDIMRLAEDDPKTIAKTRQVLERQARQLTRLVDDLLEVSRITQGKLDLRKRTVALREIVESALDQTRGLLDEAGHELRLALPTEPVFLEGDGVRLAQVLANLLSNAAKYTPEHGHIAFTATRVADAVDISVRDNGFGIPRDRINGLFEMFEQIEHTSQRGYRGLGLGLTLVKSLTEMHGGTVEARSEGPGKGSEFIVRLPVLGQVGAAPMAAERHAPSVAGKGDAACEAVERDAPSGAHEAGAVSGAEAGAPAANTVGSTTQRILVVDDNEDAGSTLAHLLRMLGHDTRVAFDGEDALWVAARFRPAVVLLDIGLPKLDGYEVARRIRRQAWGQGVLLVAVTGWGQDRDRRRASEAGFDEHLVKPVGADALRALLGRGGGE